MRTKQIRPEKQKYEFELYISRGYDEVTGKEYILFKFLTTKVFMNFIYTVNVTPKIDLVNKEISFKVEGLSAPVISLAKSGRAVFEYRLYNFRNTEYSLKMQKQDFEKNLFKLKINKSSMKLTRQPANKFIMIII
ncbi:MAG: hypothetical protein NTV87_04155 [Ignavibacteriae bacterium]|nr:hypothetical protein [Ignavibacteriota bacterium]